MVRIRSLRQWWRSSVVAPIDEIYAHLDRDAEELSPLRPPSTQRAARTDEQTRFGQQPEAQHPDPMQLHRPA